MEGRSDGWERETSGVLSDLNSREVRDGGLFHRDAEGKENRFGRRRRGDLHGENELDRVVDGIEGRKPFVEQGQGGTKGADLHRGASDSRTRSFSRGSDGI